MNSQFFPELNERINRETHERLIKEAAADRRGRKAAAWLRFLKAKKQKIARVNKLPHPPRKPSPKPTG